MEIKFNGIKANINDKLANEYISLGNTIDETEIKYLVSSSAIKYNESSTSLKQVIEESMRSIINVGRDLAYLSDEIETQTKKSKIH